MGIKKFTEYNENYDYNDIFEGEKETLEEAAKQYVIDESFLPVYKEECERSFINGAKWQQRRMYSQEDMKNALIMAKEVVEEGGKDLAKHSILDILKKFHRL